MSEPENREEEDTGAQIAPIVKLEAVEVTTGEEHEHPILHLKENCIDLTRKGMSGRSEALVLLKHKTSGKVRLVMRQAKTLKICANHLVLCVDSVTSLAVLPTMSVQEHAGNEKSCVWHATDFADDELKDELFCIRFASIENCKSFRETVTEVAESQSKKEENKDASVAVGLLEKSSVEDSKTEEKASEVEKPPQTESSKTDTDKKDEKPAPSS